jgi:carboxylate-amine ligase
MENKWRASRYGIDGKLVDFGIEEEKDERLLIAELLEFIDDVVDDLGSRKYIEDGVKFIMDNGTGADRQIEVWNKTKDIRKVVDYICEETIVGL